MMSRSTIGRCLLVVICWCAVFSGCRSVETHPPKCFYFQQGDYREIDLQSPERLLRLLNDLVAHTDDMLKLLVSEDRIEDIKSETTGIEVIYSRRVSVESRELGRFHIDRLLVPFEGKYVGDSISTRSQSQDSNSSRNP